MLKSEQKVAAVTGAISGIGKETVLQLSKIAPVAHIPFLGGTFQTFEGDCRELSGS